MFTSEQLTEGSIYTREYLSKKFNTRDATIKTGIFQPAGYQSIWLFITENKSKDSTQYKDLLHEDTLDWDGQTQGKKDRLIIEHATNGLEILVFYRANKRAFPHGGFKYEGQFRYESHANSYPTHFILKRVTNPLLAIVDTTETSKDEASYNTEKSYLHSIDNYKYSVEKIKPTTIREQAKRLKLLYCYSRKDKKLRDELDNYLSVLKRLYQIDSWHDHEISPGTEWEKEIDTRLNDADIILLLVSSYFMSSEYCYGIEMKRALERHERGEARVIPIILRPIGWQDTPIGKLQALPKNGKPIVGSWPQRDYALHDVEEGLKSVINQLLSTHSVSSTTSHNLEAALKQPENGQNLIVFHHKEQEAVYRAWVSAHHDDGLIANKESRHQWKLHCATCRHIIDPIDKGQSLFTYLKICSTSREKLYEEAQKQGVAIATGCYCQRATVSY